MTAIAQALSRAFITARDIENLRLVAMFSGVGLLASLLMLTRGIDLSPGFF